MTTLSRLLHRARRQHAVITLEQLRALGCSPAAVRHLVHTSRIVRVHRGVYALEGPLSDTGRALAAVLACGPRCTASHLTAAALRGYRTWWPARPEVTTARATGARGPAGVVLHRSATLRRSDVATVAGVPCTGPERTVVDCAPRLGVRALKALVWAAEQDGLELAALDRPGVPRALRALLDEYVPGAGLTANELEAGFFELCRRARLPAPTVQARFPAARRVDFVWHDLRLIVETDGRRSHATAIAFTEDRRRDREHFLAGGYVTLRFTWADVRLTPERVADEVRRALERRRADGFGSP